MHMLYYAVYKSHLFRGAQHFWPSVTYAQVRHTYLPSRQYTYFYQYYVTTIIPYYTIIPYKHLPLTSTPTVRLHSGMH